jgi:uncharacterized protein YodC (DUF2158 family)
MAQAFKVGDIVQLKSGGPKMTVIEIESAPYSLPKTQIRCSWFAGAKNENGYFPPDALMPAPEETPKK